ncbi:hypothetical protein EMIT048CA2_240047 [Pseudomonas chlororaphis]
MNIAATLLQNQESSDSDYICTQIVDLNIKLEKQQSGVCVVDQTMCKNLLNLKGTPL